MIREYKKMQQQKQEEEKYVKERDEKLKGYLT
jgi:hypothetical protein